MKFSSRDLHIHTSLSSCAARTADASGYIAAAARGGLELIGFANHYWDEAVPGASGWYAPQNTVHVLSLKNELTQCAETVLKEPGAPRVIFGCETEYANGTLGISREHAELFDYVLVPHSHTHMRGFVLPDSCDTPRKHADYLVRSFLGVANHPLADRITGIVHPFVPVGTADEPACELLSLITDSDFSECARAAFENNIAIELNTSSLAHASDKLMYEYSRFFHCCKDAGCAFFAGSDKHDIICEPEKDIFFTVDEIAEKLFGSEVRMLEL